MGKKPVFIDPNCTANSNAVNDNEKFQDQDNVDRCGDICLLDM